jgi:DNA-binding CsgD family transcriptional regulator
MDGVSFDRKGREMAALLYAGTDPKVIADALEIAVSTVYGRIADMCEQAHVAGERQLLIWILQHPECMQRGRVCAAGLHEVPCSCGSPHCVGGLVAHGLTPVGAPSPEVAA